YTHESSWIIDTSGRVLRNFVGADCRVSYLVTGTPKEAQEFLGPWATEMLTFADQDRSVVRALGLQALPAIVHLDHQLQVRAQAQGWNPTEWWDFTKQLATAMSWHSPMLPGDGDPPKFAGTAALG
ncbi:MAG: hypothetical protein OXF21_01010, partial [bacterium]|nr:hypothetical protein [bacterium]